MSSITTPWITYAVSLTQKLVKGMLTGPVTIFNWSFPREDVPAARPERHRDCRIAQADVGNDCLA